jgi:hypothetical protein
MDKLEYSIGDHVDKKYWKEIIEKLYKISETYNKKYDDPSHTIQYLNCEKSFWFHLDKLDSLI